MRSVLRIISALTLHAIAAAQIFAFADPTPSTSQSLLIRWKNQSIKIAISSSVISPNSSIKTGTDIRDVIRRSLASWENVSPIRFVEIPSEKQNVSPAGVSGDGVSLITIAQTPENLALFQGDWQTASARTRVFFNRRHEITEADIVLNPYAQFSDDGTFGTFDLQSTLTHEIGHLLGLEHSFSFGSAMYASFGRNGIFGLQSRRIRSLSPEDISALDALYGTQADDNSCCGTISGKLSVAGRQADLQVWAENAESGVVINTTTAAKTGTYKLDGLPAGTFHIYAQERGPRPASVASRIGDVTVEGGKTFTLNAALNASRSSEGDLRYLGINFQLADAAILVNAGRTYVIFLGGTSVPATKATVGTNSPFITVGDVLSNVEFSDRVSAIRAEVTIDPKTPSGDYSLFVETSGNVRYIVGGISVQTFVDPWDFSPFLSH